MKIETKITFGQRYRDKINKVEGIATGYRCFLFGQPQVYIESKSNHGTAIVGWILEERLEPVPGCRGS